MKNRFYKRLRDYLLALFIIITLNFFLPRLMPGDPFTFLSANAGEITVTYSAEQIKRYKAYYGLDRPFFQQYCSYLSNLFRGNIGYSIYYNETVLRILTGRARWTLAIVIAALILSSLLGTVLGCLSAWLRNGPFDKSLYSLMVVGAEIPPFLTGTALLFCGGAWLGWFPLSGGMSVFAAFGSPLDRLGDLLRHAVLPVITLALARLGEFYLLARGNMITVLTRDYIRTARGKGLAESSILFRHALKNACIPIVTRVFLSLGAAFGGALLVENVFNYPGLGRLMREAVFNRDYPLIQGIFLLVAVAVLSMNLAADLIYKKLDPRVE
ncbi:MAG: ABC transporter permease [Bacillota bacterium]|jgi:peptide/nickel transport system permease protein